MKSLYLILDLSTIFVPFLFSFHPRLAFYRHWKFAWPAILISAFIFLIWDIWFTKIGVWGFSASYISGIYIFNLPVEEVCFFISIPYSCLFTYYCLSILVRKFPFAGTDTWISGILIFFLSITAIIHISKLYTSVTFTALAMLTGYLQYYAKASWLNRFYYSWLLLMIPFAFVNGILTGTGLHNPVVWYNNAQNLGIRLGTIPFEDVFYGMLLILLNVFIFESFRQKAGSS